MKFSVVIPAVAAFASLAAAQDASDADVQTIKTQITNVISAVNTLGSGVSGFSGDVAGLTSQSSAVISALNNGASAISPISGKVSLVQASSNLLDPVNNLTLPLPIANVWSRSIKYFPLNDTPVEIVVDIDRNSSIRSLKQYILITLSIMCGTRKIISSHGHPLQSENMILLMKMKARKT